MTNDQKWYSDEVHSSLLYHLPCPCHGVPAYSWRTSGRLRLLGCHLWPLCGWKRFCLHRGRIISGWIISGWMTLFLGIWCVTINLKGVEALNGTMKQFRAFPSCVNSDNCSSYLLISPWECLLFSPTCRTHKACHHYEWWQYMYLRQWPEWCQKICCCNSDSLWVPILHSVLHLFQNWSRVVLRYSIPLLSREEVVFRWYSSSS